MAKIIDILIVLCIDMIFNLPLYCWWIILNGMGVENQKKCWLMSCSLNYIRCLLTSDRFASHSMLELWPIKGQNEKTLAKQVFCGETAKEKRLDTINRAV